MNSWFWCCSDCGGNDHSLNQSRHDHHSDRYKVSKYYVFVFMVQQHIIFLNAVFYNFLVMQCEQCSTYYLFMYILLVFVSTFVLTILNLSLTLGEYNEIVILIEGVILFTMPENNKPSLFSIIISRFLPITLMHELIIRYHAVIWTDCRYTFIFIWEEATNQNNASTLRRTLIDSGPQIICSFKYPLSHCIIVFWRRCLFLFHDFVCLYCAFRHDKN